VNGNGAKGANRAPAANASTPITASEERNRATGRRARARIAQEQAARRRRLGIIAGAITVVVIAAIVIAALVLNQPSSQTTALVDPNALSSPPTQLAIGSKAPNFDSATIDGKHYTLAGQHGHPVLMEMFAVWCPHCQAESAVLNQLDKSYASKGLRSFSVLASPFGKDYDTSRGTDTRLADKSDITWFKNTFNVAHPILVDRNFATANKYGLVNGPGGQGFPRSTFWTATGSCVTAAPARYPTPPLPRPSTRRSRANQPSRPVRQKPAIDSRESSQ